MYVHKNGGEIPDVPAGPTFGDNPTGMSKDQIAAKIREVITTVLGSDLGTSVPILYGGSVTIENINNYCRLPELNGALVGGASLDPAALVQLAIAIQ